MLEAIIAGLVQGFLEWLPVSSSGQATLTLISLFGVEPEKAYMYSLMLHGATALSAIVWYRRELIKAILKPKDPLTIFILLSYLVSLAVAFPLYNISKNLASQDILTLAIGVAFIITGLILYATQKKHVKIPEIKEPTAKDAMLMGIAQGFAIIPGLSRSAVTIATLLARGYNPRQAVQLSFIASIPATLTAGAYELFLEKTGSSAGLAESMAALTIAFVAGLAGIALMEGLASRLRFDVFLVAIGLIVVLLTFPFS
ncbi:MAG: undecaprenyl-diphosphate phosphatase [Desulfurococcales archaeon]|nr:undecaprenyl-diphosphate phosphatase [Desulfurococcales archaeon]